MQYKCFSLEHINLVDIILVYDQMHTSPTANVRDAVLDIIIFDTVFHHFDIYIIDNHKRPIVMSSNHRFIYNIFI